MLLQDASGQYLEDKPQVSYGHNQIYVHVGAGVGRGYDTGFGDEYKDNFLGIHMQS